MLKLNEHKHPQHQSKTQSFLSAKKLYLPLCQHIGRKSKVCVKKGQVVEKNQIIAEGDGECSAALHAPSRAKVLDIKKCFHAKLKKAEGIVLEVLEEKEEKSENKPQAPFEEIDKLTQAELTRLLSNKGIVGMGGAGFPTPLKLNPPKDIHTLIINGCECEPYLASDYRLMAEKLTEIFKGVEIIAQLIKPKQVVFAVEDNKIEPIKKLNLFIHTKKFKIPSLKLKILKSRYPQGGEKQLIYSTTGCKVSAKMLPFDQGCVVFNVATCYSVFEAVYFGQPLTKRIVTLCGEALIEPKNLWVNIGTTPKELVDRKIIEFNCPPKKIIFGGPMMGDAVTNLNYPILKTTSGILFLKNDTFSKSIKKETACIGCGKCIDNCPINLMPLEYVKLVKNKVEDSLDDFYIKDCIECGCCSYVCPAKIPILDYIKLGKSTLK